MTRLCINKKVRNMVRDVLLKAWPSHGTHIRELDTFDAILLAIDEFDEETLHKKFVEIDPIFSAIVIHYGDSIGDIIHNNGALFSIHLDIAKPFKYAKVL